VTRVAAAVLLLVLAACDAPAPQTCVSTCTTPEPGPEECAIEVSLDAGCAAFFVFAEVAVDQCLEPLDLHPGETWVTCARFPVGATFKWTVRSEDVEPQPWQWGPWEDTCPRGGVTLPYALSCR
jgi:hypothetical protein